MKKIFITDFAVTCNLGANKQEIYENAIRGDSSHFTFSEDFVKGAIFPLGKINIDLPKISDENFNIRCNKLLLKCLQEINIKRITEKYLPNKIGIIIATTNSGIEEFAQTNIKSYLEIGNPSEFIKKHLGLTGFRASVSVACASGIKAFSMAKRLLENNICDCVIAGGSDSLSNLAIHGFNSLELLSKQISIPFSKNRNGINIGEGAALFILEKESFNSESIEIAGIGETSDAYHYSTPEPTGTEAMKAIKLALQEASISSSEIDYINLHGTGTISNDIMEANAINKIFGENIFCSSTKPLTGHCLGAAASIETALCCILLNKINGNKLIYPHIYDNEYDKQIAKIKLAEQNTKLEKLDTILSNAFGFGGANAVMILRRKNEQIQH